MRVLRCYISASFSTDLTNIIKILKEEKIRPIVISEIKNIGLNIAESVQKEISKADLVLGILDKNSSNENIFFELGIALAHKKQILLITPPSIKQVSSLLSSIITIRTDIYNLEAIRFHLQQTVSFLTRKKPHKLIGDAISEPKKIMVVEKKVIIKKKTISKYKPIRKLSGELIKEIENIPQNEIKEVFLQKTLVEALETSGVSYILEKSTPTGRIDLAVWADKFHGLVGNPFPIEIKRKINKESLENVQRLFSSHFEKSSSRFGMVVYFEDSMEDIRKVDKKYPTTFFVQINSLLKMLEEKSFVDIVIDLRNSKMHGGAYGKNF